MYYSQCGEDEFLNTNYFKNKRNGVYIELGALDGVLYSNTKFFEDQLDWKGILIEPHPYKFQELTNNRPKNYLFNNLVSFIEDEVVFRFFLDNYSGVSGVEHTLPKEHLEGFYTYVNEPQGKVTIRPKTLTEIVKSTDIKHIDLLSLDVEGHEYEVLLSWDFSIPIDVILIETLGGSQSEKEEKCREILIKNGYKFDTKFQHNEVFILENNYNTEKEVTLFITSCGRPHLLKRTLESFVKFNTYPIKEAILCEDSGLEGIVDFVKDILPYPIIFCYNPIRIGQMKTIEKYTQLIKTPYVFHLEDDYEFFDSGFIELSFQILDSDPKITQVLLEDEQQTYPKIEIGNPLCYKVVNSPPYGEDGQVTLFSWRPSLKRIEIQKLRMPYEDWDDEHTILLQVNKLGLYSALPKNVTNGFCRHIGVYEHVHHTDVKILRRCDFPDKINIKLKDI